MDFDVCVASMYAKSFCLSLVWETDEGFTLVLKLITKDLTVPHAQAKNFSNTLHFNKTKSVSSRPVAFLVCLIKLKRVFQLSLLI